MFNTVEQLQNLMDNPNLAGNQYSRSNYQLANTLYGMTDEEISKALATSGIVGTNASAMIGESLDPIVKSITLQSPNFTPLMKRLYTFKANAISEEFVRLTALGLAEGSWRPEGQLGVQDASQMERVTQNVRFLGQVGAVTIEMMEAGTKKYGDIKAFEAVNRTHQLLLNLDRDLIWANSTLNDLAFQGLRQQMQTTSTYNINKVGTTGTAGSRTTYITGGSMSAADLRQQSEIFLLKNGTPTACYLAPSDKYTISSEQDGNVRWYRADQQSRIAVGMKVDQVDSDWGPIDLVWDVWLRNLRGKLNATPPDPSGTFHSECPAQLGVAPTGAAAAGGYLPNDTYYYGIAPVNEVGEGPITLQSTGYTTTNTNGTVTVTVTHPASTANIKAYRLYRSTTNGTDYTKMRLVSETAINTAAATQDIDDDGSILPGSREALMVNERMLAMGLLQAPNMFDLARIDNTFRFGINAMAVLQTYNPYNIMRWYNVGGSAADPA